jgi:hypothetical protein
VEPNNLRTGSCKNTPSNPAGIVPTINNQAIF